MATKKTKNVEIPIDQRETFVSIRKSFADSEGNVKEKLKTLYELQEADNSIEKIIHQRGELPEEVEALQKEIAEIKDQIKRAGDFIKGMDDSIERGKQEILECDNKISKYQKQVDAVANSREYDSITKEIENQDLLKQIAEKNIAEAREKIQDAKKDIDAFNDDLSIREDDLAAKNDELDHIVESTSKEEARLRKVREACAAKIDARTMSAYERIRASVRNHLAVVPVYNGACGGCFNSIIPQRLIDIDSGKKLIICEHCGRIIVNPQSFEEA